ncbi:MAG: hypothetical protein AB7P14_23805 [Blastocatellales bacterium]
MSESDYQRIVEHIIQSAANPMIATDTAIEAAQKFGEMAEQEQIGWALAGGLAMHLYGSQRLTNNVAIIASKELSLTAKHRLSFGGSSYTLQIGKYEVPIDWIVRNDGYEQFYRAALQEVVRLPNGLRIVTPEWLVILKFNAGRQKDLDDIVFLLRRKNLVDRTAVKRKVTEVAGEGAWLTMLAGFRRLCDLADGKTTEPGKYYEQE